MSTAQIAALRFLARSDLAFRIGDAPAAQIKIRTARPLLRAGLIVLHPDADLDADAQHGGWTIAALTDKGRAALAR
jgi:hypothetical protein